MGLDPDSDRLSRLHLLLVQDADEIMAIDTGSTNGTRSGDKEISVTCLQDGDWMELAGELEVGWRAVS